LIVTFRRIAALQYNLRRDRSISLRLSRSFRDDLSQAAALSGRNETVELTELGRFDGYVGS
jgi:hypothetical protein